LVSNNWVEGENQVNVAYQDDYGNVGEYDFTLVYDTVKPIITFQAPLETKVKAQKYIDIAWSIDGVPQDSGLLVEVREGFNTIIKKGYDKAGNLGVDSIVIEVRYPQEIEVNLVKGLASDDVPWSDYVADTWGREASQKEIGSIRIIDVRDSSYRELAWAEVGKVITPLEKQPYMFESERSGFVMHFEAPMPINGGFDRNGNTRSDYCLEESTGTLDENGNVIRMWDFYFESLVVNIYDNHGQFVNSYQVIPRDPVRIDDDYYQSDDAMMNFEVEIPANIISTSGVFTGNGIYIFNGSFKLGAVRRMCNYERDKSFEYIQKKSEFLVNMGLFRD
jgi:hypothetical protein